VPEGGALVAAAGLGVDLGGRSVLADVDVEVRAGELLALVGPNGAGKSTLLAALVGDVAPCAGSVLVEGRAPGAWSHVELAMRRAVLPQHVAVSFPFEVRDVVRMGRSPWAGTAREDDDDEIVRAALAAADVTDLRRRRVPTLSGGERARVALARVLAQDTQLLLLDEPTAALDVHHQELVFDVARARVRQGDGVVTVVHDLGLAAAHADRVALLAQGRLVAAGPPAGALLVLPLRRLAGAVVRS
jgi:iron complex transport system ATP-binding protein